MAEKIKLPKLDSLKHVHIVGVCGTLMGAFAAYLKRRGIRVTGSDQNVYPPMSEVLSNAGVELMSGYSDKNLTQFSQKPDLVVIGNVISASNLEAREAIDHGYCYSSLPEAMEELFLRDTRNLVVAGTHGKTTTSSLLAHVLVQCGKDPSYFIGGVSQDLPFSFQVSSLDKGRYFVLEGDEYDTAFWDKVPKFNHYRPDDVILTSVEYDHADIYANLEAVISAFEGLVRRVRPGGKFIACYDYPVIKKLLKETDYQVISYSSSDANGARFYPRNIQVVDGVTQFEVMDKGTSVVEIKMQLPGAHNVANALAVWIEACELGLKPKAIKEALGNFRGVKRRQEVRGEIEGVLVIDDFAHHPTAVRETLKALKAKYAGRRLTAVFEPRSATSRRKVFQKDYASAFSNADQIFIASPFDQTKISAEDQFSSDMLVQDLIDAGKKAGLMTTVEEGVTQVAHSSRRGDVIAVLSNGGFGGFIPKLLDKLRLAKN